MLARSGLLPLLFTLTLGAQLAAQGLNSPRPDAQMGRGAVYLKCLRLDGDRVQLRIWPGKGYHLNGPGYPPLRIELSGLEEGLSLEGLAEGTSATWVIRHTKDATRLGLRVRAIACGPSSCLPIDQSLELPVDSLDEK